MNTRHLHWILWLEEDTIKFSKASATRQKLTMDLIALGLLEIDSEDYIRITSRANGLYEQLVDAANNWIQA